MSDDTETVTTGEDSEEQPQEPVGAEVQERRSSFRLNKVLGAEIEHEGTMFKARLFVIDISATGFRATNQSMLPVDVDITVRIVLEPKADPVQCSARIVWSKELPMSGMFQFGFEFQDMPTDSRERLEAFIEQEKARSLAPKEDVYLGRPWTPLR